MSLTVTALPDAVGIQIQRSMGRGGFQVQASPREAGAIYDAIEGCLSNWACEEPREYEGDPDRGVAAVGLDLVPGEADPESEASAARVFVRKEDSKIILRFVTHHRSASLDLDEEEARNVLVALREVANELVGRNVGG